MKRYSRIFCTALCIALFLLTSLPAIAADFPVKPITIVVPFKAGGNVDLSCRIIAEEMGKLLNTNVVVENKEGGGAIIGQTYAINKPADGYTLLAITSSFTTNVLGGDANYKLDDVRMVGMFTFDPEILVVSEALNISTYEEFVKLAKEKELINSTPGFSTSHHVASVLYSQMTDTNFKYLHTDGSADQTVQLAGGHADMGFTTYGGAASLIEQGKIKMLALADDQRSAIYPDVPTFSELGISFKYGAWRGFSVPAATPDEVVKKLEDALKQTLESENVRKKFADAGFPITYMDSASFQAMVEKDFKDMEEVTAVLNAQ